MTNSPRPNWSVCHTLTQTLKFWVAGAYKIYYDYFAHLMRYIIIKCSNFRSNVFIIYRYPGETMKIIADLAAGLGNEHRNRKQRNAQRITMDASNAAEQKISEQLSHEIYKNIYWQCKNGLFN